jgi:hypothetical protein
MKAPNQYTLQCRKSEDLISDEKKEKEAGKDEPVVAGE